VADKPKDASAPKPDDEDPTERRRHIALRKLVDEMMAGIRAATISGETDADERERAEEALARIMAQVQREAFRRD
jgi:hypothetical protein